jgi:hypothetical protein
MHSENNVGKGELSLSPKIAAEIIRRLAEDRSAAVDVVVRTVLAEVQRFEVIDLWEQQDVAVTYWVLMLTGVNQQAEMDIARELLVWQAFFSKEAARVACVQSSERTAFKHCSSHFSVHSYPTLLFSDRPDMQSFIRMDAGFLSILAAQEGTLQRFFARLHSMVEGGMSLQRIQDQMMAEAFYRGVKIAYKEIKGLVSIKIGP